MPLHNPRQPDDLVSLSQPLGDGDASVQGLCVRLRVCLPVSVRTHVLTGGKGSRRPYQLDDVRDAEPVGWLDVLASFHEALVALKPRSTGMRQAPTAAGQHPCPQAGGWEPGQHPIRQEAGSWVLTTRPQGLG